MMKIDLWLEQYVQALRETFGQRIWFIGLQGSYGRGEATESSDIDVVAILDTLSAEDIAAYNRMLDTLPCRQLICGFLSGRDELLHWEPSDLFQFYYDTTPVFGSLDEVREKTDAEAIDRAIKTGACNIYHGCVHNMLHEKSDDILRGLYKGASFVIQAIVYRQTGTYVRHLQELLDKAVENDRQIIAGYMAMKQGGQVDFEPMSETVFAWAKEKINGEDQRRGAMERSSAGEQESR